MLNHIPPSGSRRWSKNLNKRDRLWLPWLMLWLFASACGYIIGSNVVSLLSGGLVP